MTHEPTAVTPAPATSESTVVLTPAALAHAAEDAMAARPLKEPWRTALLAVLGGAWIALGFVFYITSQTGSADAPWGLAKVVGGVVFSVGLLLVIITGAELFTSTTMTLIALAARRITLRQFATHWFIVWIGNFVGAWAVIALCYFGGLQHNDKGLWGKVVLDAAALKLHHSWTEAFTLGIFANLAVCLAVWMGFAGRTLTDKALAVVGPVALFVATGMEHSIANMFLLPFAKVLKETGGDNLVKGIDMSAYADITWSHIFLGNLVPVTLGNIIGGGVIAGLMQWFLARPKTAH